MGLTTFVGLRHDFTPPDVFAGRRRGLHRHRIERQGRWLPFSGNGCFRHGLVCDDAGNVLPRNHQHRTLIETLRARFAKDS
jgi:hypothetical protein